MVFGKINSDTIRRTANNVKFHAMKGYQNTKSFLNSLDQGVQTGKKIYSAVAPLIEAFAPGIAPQISGKTSKLIKDYDDIKERVTKTHDDVQQKIGETGQRLKKQGVKLNF